MQQLQELADRLSKEINGLKGELTDLDKQEYNVKTNITDITNKLDMQRKLSPENIAKTARWEMIKTIFFYNVMPYLVIILIFVLLTWSASRRSSSSSKKQSSIMATKGALGKLWYMIKSFFNTYIGNALSFGAGTRSFFAMLNPFGADLPSINRDREHAGRCDNLNFFEVGSKCQNTVRPKDFEWVIDPAEFREYEQVPDEVKQKLLIDKSLKVIIPVEKNDTFYAPQCDKAYYDDGQQTLAELLEDSDDGRYCKKRYVESTNFELPQDTSLSLSWQT